MSFSLMDTSDTLRLSFASLMPRSVLVIGCAMVGTGLAGALPSVMEAALLIDFMVDCGELLAGLQVPSDSVLNVDDSGCVDLRVNEVRLNISIKVLLLMATRLRKEILFIWVGDGVVEVLVDHHGPVHGVSRFTWRQHRTIAR